MTGKRFSRGVSRRGFWASVGTTLGLCGMMASLLLSGCGTGQKSYLSGSNNGSGVINFSEVASTNGTTTNITQTEAAAAFQGTTLNASLTESGTHTVVRVLSIQLGDANDASLSVGTTYPISPDVTVAAGKARVTYVEEGGGTSQKFWDAQGGSVVVTAHDSQNTTLRVDNATMTPLNNYGSTDLPTGTFTINATGKF